jgi:hypothetical protein
MEFRTGSSACPAKLPDFLAEAGAKNEGRDGKKPKSSHEMCLIFFPRTFRLEVRVFSSLVPQPAQAPAKKFRRLAGRALAPIRNPFLAWSLTLQRFLHCSFPEECFLKFFVFFVAVQTSAGQSGHLAGQALAQYEISFPPVRSY